MDETNMVFFFNEKKPCWRKKLKNLSLSRIFEKDDFDLNPIC